MTRMTELEYQLLKRKMAEKRSKSQSEKTSAPDPTQDTHKADLKPESVLAGKIMQYCKTEGFPCQCFRQSKKAKGFLVPGWPD